MCASFSWETGFQFCKIVLYLSKICVKAFEGNIWKISRNKKFHQMTQEPVGHLICRLALPCIISMLVTAFYNMADTFFVGMLKTPAPPAPWAWFFPYGHHPGSGLFLWPRQRQLISRELGRQILNRPPTWPPPAFSPLWTAGILICVLGQLFLTPLATLLGSTPTILPTPGTICGSYCWVLPG